MYVKAQHNQEMSRDKLNMIKLLVRRNNILMMLISEMCCQMPREIMNAIANYSTDEKDNEEEGI